MRFKTYLGKEPRHSDIVSCIAWNTTDEVLSCADDHEVLIWNLITNETTKLLTLSNDLFPTDMHILKTSNPSGLKKQIGGDVFVITTTDGKFHLINRTGRIEKSVEAHRGAVLAGRWSYDGTAFATAGEDGSVKIWSRSGMLRSTLVSTSFPIYSLAWGPNSDQILHTSSRQLVIKPLQPNSKPLQWRAHDGLILKVAWNPSNNLIISGGEDCKYKVWDSYGRILYSSHANDYPVTSVSWSPNGEMFCVGSFNSLRLCDRTGWSHSLDKPETQSLFCLEWSSDGTQVAGACGNGHVIFAHVVERRLEWKHFEATVRGRKTITVQNVSFDLMENLDFRDNIIKVSFEYNHLIVLTSTQCYIYSTKNWNTPIIFDLKEGNVSLVVQAEKHFLFVDGQSMYIYNYDGRLVSSPKWPLMRTDYLNQSTVSLSNDTVAVRNKGDEKIIHIFDAVTGKYVPDGKPFTHKMEVLEVALDQCGPSINRRLAIVDKNRDLYLLNVRALPNASKKIMKLGTMMHSIRWNDNSNMLASLQDGKLMIFYYPAVVFADKNLLATTLMQKDDNDFGKNPQIMSFVGNHVNIRRADGSILSSATSPYPSVLHGYVASNRWDDAVRLCRYIKDETLWACLAGMSLSSKDLKTAEIAYAAIKESDKVECIQYIKKLPLKDLQTSEMALLNGNVREAESVLLGGGLSFRAIMLNLRLYRWDRALELAAKNGNHVDTVLAFRQKYLETLDMPEDKSNFLQLMKEVEVKWDAVNEKIEEEYKKEKNMTPSDPAARRRTSLML
ncbi:intraflagellar transport protein 80 homolog [Parasteatoda tepidariorum]|uniref:Intraflagellar transport protein 80-like protein n=1 Tax=Parasteatoda tepidariorum TaxID=114398 RepID=A0A2L2YIL1_PARTP|nr:intraflagellar transport protein 80 homolog [Parasteatoda tepidariorum]